jgi:hypothetical protein
MPIEHIIQNIGLGLGLGLRLNCPKLELYWPKLQLRGLTKITGFYCSNFDIGRRAVKARLRLSIASDSKLNLLPESWGWVLAAITTGLQTASCKLTSRNAGICVSLPTYGLADDGHRQSVAA